MSEPFIAPEGAMQFEITHTRRAGTECLRGKVVWVVNAPIGPSNPIDLCDCKIEFAILKESLPDVLRNLHEGLRVVCKCNGHLIK